MTKNKLKPRDQEAFESLDQLHADERCKARCHLGQYFPLYDFAFACYQSQKKARHGRVFLSVRKSAKWCGLSPSAAVRARDYLVAHGWLLEIKRPTDGKNGAGIYEVISHEDWIEEHGNAACVTDSKAIARDGKGNVPKTTR
jgi:hypothetical protein